MGRVNRTNDRVLIGELDSTRQAEALADDHWLDRLEDPEDPALLEALGLLRFEALLSRRLVVTDAQALDGRLLMGLALSGLLRQLRPADSVPIIEVRARATGLRRSAWAMVDAEQGGAFRSSFLTHGADVYQQSPSTAATGTKVSAIGDYLVRAGADAAEVEALGAGWKALRAAARDGHLSVKRWDPERPWNEMVKLADDYLPLDHLSPFLGDESDTLDEARRLGSMNVRSHFLGALGAGGWDPEQRELLESWFAERYRRAAAFQHRADYRAVQSDSFRRAYSTSLARETVARRTTFIALPEGFISDLGRLPTITWQATYAKNYADLREWWAVGDTGSLERALTSIARELGSPRGGRHALRSLTTMGLTISADVGTLPLDLNAGGVAATVAIGIGVTAMTVAAGAVGRNATVKVTDYLDDVDP